MTIKKAILFLLFIGTTLSSFAQRRSYFIEVTSQDSLDYTFSYGKFYYENEELKKELMPEIDSEASFLTLLRDEIMMTKDEQRNLFMYIHGMWGHQDWYQKEVQRQFNTVILPGQEHPFGLTVSFIWHSGIQYFDNSAHAYTVGKYFSDLFSQILELEFYQKKILCHSMGNRVFQGIFSNVNVKAANIDEVFLVAADLEVDIFDENQPLEKINKLVKEVKVYVHNNDRSLGISRSLNKNDRLGLNADYDLCKNKPGIQVIDVSVIKDNQGFAPAFSNHRYFYTSPSVRDDLKKEILDISNIYRTPLEDNCRVKLNPIPADQR